MTEPHEWEEGDIHLKDDGDVKVYHKGKWRKQRSPHTVENVFRFALVFLLAAILAVLLVINSHLPAEHNIKVCYPECESTEQTDG